MARTQVTFGALTVSIGQLTLGQLKRVRADMQLLIGMRRAADEMPSAEQLDAMLAVLFVSASAADATLTREALSAAVDDLPYDVGMRTLGEAIGVLMETSKLTGGPSTGEAASPATERSISSGSTDSLSPSPDGTSSASTPALSLTPST